MAAFNAAWLKYEVRLEGGGALYYATSEQANAAVERYGVANVIGGAWREILVAFNTNHHNYSSPVYHDLDGARFEVKHLLLCSEPTF